MTQNTIQNATVVVTGGAGFIGSHLVRRLLADGAKRVVVLDSLRYGDRANLSACGERVELVPFTLGTDNPSRLAAILAGTEHLFHLAAEKHNQSKDDPSRILRANIEGSQQLYEAAARADVRRIVYASSLYAYGRMQGPAFREDEAPSPRTVYGTSKLAGEHLLRTAAVAHGFSWNIVRYMFVYGPRQFAGLGYKSVILRNFERMMNDEAMVVHGDGMQALDYVFVDDAVEATVRALACGTSGEVFNVGTGQATTVLDLLIAMRLVGGKPCDIEHGAPDWTAGSMRVGDISKARLMLGWRPIVELREGLDRTLRWIRSQRYD